MNEIKATDKAPDQQVSVEWSDFLQEQPPGNFVLVLKATVLPQVGLQDHKLKIPELKLHCPSQTCGNYMFFNCDDYGGIVQTGKWLNTYLTYSCRNCGDFSKMFSIAIQLIDWQTCKAYKFGEIPPFGPPIPSRVIRLIQPDRELFLSGRRCENQALGIGAFSYYRRVVENQWERLVDEIIKVGKALNVSEAVLVALAEARNENQFSKSVSNLKNAFPPALLINGQNPLVLLHSALSQGVHDLSDEQCLGLAKSIRVVLVELAEKIGQALKDEKEINDAVKRLQSVQSKKKSQRSDKNSA